MWQENTDYRWKCLQIKHAMQQDFQIKDHFFSFESIL